MEGGREGGGERMVERGSRRKGGKGEREGGRGRRGEERLLPTHDKEVC